MTASQLLDDLAHRTCSRLRAAHQVRCSQGETTITDTNLLDLMIARPPGLRVYKATGRDEPGMGFDWEFFIGNDATGWLRYPIQAKKLNPGDNRYSSLRQKVNGRFQIDILESYARAVGGIPLYCFYNGVTDAQARACWHCAMAATPGSMGCSLVPLCFVRKAHDQRGAKSFERLHGIPWALPWRCLLRCLQLLPQRSCAACPGMPESLPDHPLAHPEIPPRRYPELPRHIRHAEGGRVETALDIDRATIDSEEVELAERDARNGHPRWIAVIEVNPNDDLGPCQGPCFTGAAE